MKRSEDAKVSFWSVLSVFLFVIPIPSHACLCSSKASFDMELDLERGGGLGWAGLWNIGSVGPFLLVWGRFDLSHGSGGRLLPLRPPLTRFRP